MNLDKISIIPFHPQYLPHFVSLNAAWLEQYFYIEDHDREVLENAQNYIIDKGGFIFFALINDQVVGTVALLNEPEGMELSKMAVDERYRGSGIGQLLLEHCIKFAQIQGWPTLHLYSNKQLVNAIHIYTKYGFREINMQGDIPYKRSNIKMELVLRNGINPLK